MVKGGPRVERLFKFGGSSESKEPGSEDLRKGCSRQKGPKRNYWNTTSQGSVRKRKK